MKEITWLTFSSFGWKSIGSLGKGGNFVQVENIYVSKVYLKGTTNGARIKTWQVKDHIPKFFFFFS